MNRDLLHLRHFLSTRLHALLLHTGGACFSRSSLSSRFTTSITTSVSLSSHRSAARLRSRGCHRPLHDNLLDENEQATRLRLRLLLCHKHPPPLAISDDPVWNKHFSRGYTERIIQIQIQGSYSSGRCCGGAVSIARISSSKNSFFPASMLFASILTSLSFTLMTMAMELLDNSIIIPGARPP